MGIYSMLRLRGMSIGPAQTHVGALVQLILWQCGLLLAVAPSLHAFLKAVTRTRRLRPVYNDGGY